jgi:Domain of unknown function (DUF1824)
MLVLLSCISFLAVSTRSFCHGFQVSPSIRLINDGISTFLNSEKVAIAHDTLIDSSRILADWDRWFSSNVADPSEKKTFSLANITRNELVDAVLALNQKATDERTVDATTGRCMLGICASSAEEGIATLKSWVTNLGVPRGLLHGMDIDGVPIEFKGGVYIKYNSGGVYTFADIRKSQMGFNAIWKPGDATLEEYDGTYRGVYFQVELADGEFRQYLLPLDLFDGFPAK